MSQLEKNKTTIESEQQKKILEEEKIKKLERLKLLEAKLKQIEQQEKFQKDESIKKLKTESKIIVEENRISNSIQKLSEDDYLQQIDKELEEITNELDIDLESIEKENNQTSTYNFIENNKDVLESLKIIGENESILREENVQQTVKTTQSRQEIISSTPEIEKELKKLEQKIIKEQYKAAISVSIFDKLCEEYQWLKQPQYSFMYVMPNKKQDKNNFQTWLDDWKKVLLDYARISVQHIIYFKKLLSEKPWSEFRNRTEALSEIIEALVKDKMAMFLDKQKEKIRIYWNSLENWANIIVNWAHENAYTDQYLLKISEMQRKNLVHYRKKI